MPERLLVGRQCLGVAPHLLLHHAEVCPRLAVFLLIVHPLLQHLRRTRRLSVGCQLTGEGIHPPGVAFHLQRRFGGQQRLGRETLAPIGCRLDVVAVHAVGEMRLDLLRNFQGSVELLLSQLQLSQTDPDHRHLEIGIQCDGLAETRARGRRIARGRLCTRQLKPCLDRVWLCGGQLVQCEHGAGEIPALQLRHSF